MAAVPPVEPAHGGPRLRPWHIQMTGRDPAEAHRASTPLELLFDLCFVVAVAQAAGSLHHDLAEGQVGHGTLNYLVVFFAIWWPWMNFTWFASAYDTDDVQYRLLTFVQIAGVLVVAAGVPAAFDHQDFAVMVVGYVIMRVALVAQWLRAAREDRVGRPVALRFAIGIALIQLGWILRLVVGWSEAGYLTFAILCLLELAVPAWAERAGRHTPWHGGHIVERYGLFTIIVLGECVLATTTATQAAFEAGGTLWPLLTVAVAGLLLVFAMWWSYFKHEPDVGHHRTLRSMIAWGYGHYFVFAAVAALGAGLAVATDTTLDAADLGPAVAAGTVAIPVVVFLVAVAILHARGLPRIMRQVAATSVLVLATALAAGWIGVPAAVLVMALLACGLVALNVATIARGGT
jgi:low temperature requirement protein LtrA